jgi:ABC-type Fe3+-hydroxamate transport system substrate-binding protein
LGLGERVIGITKFCIKPKKWHQSKTRIGGTKTIDFEKIKHLRPDLIIANKEENTKEDIEQLMKLYPVWISDINTFKEALIAIEKIGVICDKKSNSQQLIKEIKKRKTAYKTPILTPNPVLYLIWKDPYMTVGKSTYIDDILKILGYVNSFTNERYKEITLEQIKELNPSSIFLSSEPYPFKEKHIKEFKEALPNTSCKLVDGELFSWYGSRLLYLFENNIFL